MSSLSFEQYLIKHLGKDEIKITDFYAIRDVVYEDRDNIESTIKETVDNLLESTQEEAIILKELLESIKSGEYMILRSESCDQYWRQLQIKSHKRQREKRAIIERKSKRIREKQEAFPKEKDSQVAGLKESIGTVIKRKAHYTLLNRKYSGLDDNCKNIVSNGFNSILDLTDGDKSKENHRSLFTKKEWIELKAKWCQPIKWRALDEKITQGLKEIEEAAVLDVKKAYTLSLQKRIDHAFTNNEAYFEVYSYLLNLMYKYPNILSSSHNSCMTESDFVVKVWSQIIEAVFGDNNMFCIWGESVSKESSAAKSLSSKERSRIGDKVDSRICSTGADGKTVDLINVEFAKVLEDSKFHLDHRKILRESKTIGDVFYRDPHLKPNDKINIKAHCIQITGVEGQIVDVELVDDGLYIAKKLITHYKNISSCFLVFNY